MTKSKAAIFEGIGKPLIIDEIDVDDPKDGRSAGEIGRDRLMPHRSLVYVRRRHRNAPSANFRTRRLRHRCQKSAPA